MYKPGILACVLIILLVSTSGCSSLSTVSVPAIKQDTSGEKSLVELPAVPDQYVAQPAITPKTGLDPVPTPTLQERLPPVDSSQGTATSGTGTSGSGSDITVNSSVPATATTTPVPTTRPTNVPTTIPPNVPTVEPTTTNYFTHYLPNSWPYYSAYHNTNHCTNYHTLCRTHYSTHWGTNFSTNDYTNTCSYHSSDN